MTETPIGIFDSGLGGLTVLAEARRLLPGADLVYVADRARAPYGERSLDEVRSFAEEITRTLVAAGARIVVLACNTASAAALHSLRRDHPDISFVGMEPAVKPAVEATRSGVIGVLATPATFQGELFASVVDRFAGAAQVIPMACPGLADRVEAGLVDGPETEGLVRTYVDPLLAQGVDTLVLACTHYPFLVPVIRRVAGPATTVLDPTGAVARQVARVAGAIPPDGARLRMWVTGPLDGVAELTRRLAAIDARPEPFRPE